MKSGKVNFLTIFLFIFCASFVFVVASNAQVTENIRSEALITMKRDGSSSGCVEVKSSDYRCPSSYSISVAEDGTVIYEGISSVRIRGKRTFKISREKVKEFIADFERVKFFDLKDEYVAEYLPNGVTIMVDHAVKTYLTLKTGNKTKTVYNFYGAPKELNDLQEEIDQISRHLQK